MSGAPSVTYPVGRSRLAGRFVATISLAAAACWAAWLFLGSPPGVRQGAAAVAWLACTAAAARTVQRLPTGCLIWHGDAWTWIARGKESRAVEVTLAWDLLGVLLLVVRPADAIRAHRAWYWPRGRAQWLWLEPTGDEANWWALRRAVFSRSGGFAPSGAAGAGS